MASNGRARPTRLSSQRELPYDFEPIGDRETIYDTYPPYLWDESEPVFEHFLETYLVDAYVDPEKKCRDCAYQVRHGVLLKIRCPEWWGRVNREGRFPTPLVTVLFSAPDAPDLPRNLQIHVKDEQLDSFFNERLRIILGRLPRKDTQ